MRAPDLRAVLSHASGLIRPVVAATAIIPIAYSTVTGSPAFSAEVASAQASESSREDEAAKQKHDLFLTIRPLLRDEIYEVLGLDEVGRQHADVLYAQYREEVEHLAIQTYQELQRTGGEEIERANEQYWERIRSKGHITKEEAEWVEELRRQRDEITVPYYAERNAISAHAESRARVFMQNWLRQLQSDLEIEQDRFDQIGRLVRRRLFLTKSETHRDFQIRFDLIELLQESFQDVGTGLPQSNAADLSDDERHLLRELGLYELRLDAILQRRIAQITEPKKIEEMLIGHAPASREGQFAQARLAEYRKNLYLATTDTIRRITPVIERIHGPAVAASIERQFNESYCPGLYGTRWSDFFEDWMQAREDLTQQQRIALASVLQMHKEQLDRLRRKAVREGVEAVFEHASPSGPWPEQLEYHAILKELHKLHRRDYERVEALLSSAQKADFTDQIRDKTTGRLRYPLFGQWSPGYE